MAPEGPGPRGPGGAEMRPRRGTGGPAEEPRSSGGAQGSPGGSTQEPRSPGAHDGSKGGQKGPEGARGRRPGAQGPEGSQKESRKGPGRGSGAQPRSPVAWKGHRRAQKPEGTQARGASPGAQGRMSPEGPRPSLGSPGGAQKEPRRSSDQKFDQKVQKMMGKLHPELQSMLFLCSDWQS